MNNRDTVSEQLSNVSCNSDSESIQESRISTNDTYPSNFANRPTEEVKAITSIGGKASHGNCHDEARVRLFRRLCFSCLPSKHRKDSATIDGRRANGTFTKGPEAAKAGYTGGLHSHENDGEEVAYCSIDVQLSLTNAVAAR